MKVCPNCGKENADHYEFCIECGTPFEKQVEHPRTTITENIRFAFKLAGSNFKVFYPTLVAFVGGIVVFIVMFLSIGVSFIGYEPDTIPTIPTAGILIFFILFLALMYLGLVSIPTFQHVYMNAVQGVEINLRESFKYGRSRFLSYLLVFLLMGVLFVIISFSALALFPLFQTVPPDVMGNLDEINYMLFFGMMPWFLNYVTINGGLLSCFYGNGLGECRDNVSL
ncbi:zinc-ribbon domain-containing protein, partial [Thermoproteota archaeon]